MAHTHAVILVSFWVLMWGTGRKVNSLAHLNSVPTSYIEVDQPSSGGPHLCCDPDKSLGVNMRDRENG